MNVLVAVSPPGSATARVIVAVPDCPAAGVTVTVRVAPVPASCTPDAGTRVVFDEVAVTVRPEAGVSASETMNDSGPAKRASPP